MDRSIPNEEYGSPNYGTNTDIEFIIRYGVPEILHTDQGGNFESILIRVMPMFRYNKNQDYTVPPPIRRND